MRYAITLLACILLAVAPIAYLTVSGVDEGQTLGEGDPTRAQEFTNVSLQAGLSGFRGDNMAWGDFNNDGYLDLLVRGPSSNYLFRNEGDGTFTEVSNATGVNITRGYSQWADYNGDGYLDFYTAGNDDHLFRNNGPPNWDFTDVTSQAGNPSDGVQSEGIAWGDYDRDGYPDIFTVGWRKPGDLQWPYAGEPDRLYHNNGDGTFTDVSLSVGLRPRSTSYAGMGVVWCDPNEDGWPDIYVSNYHLNPNQLWINNRDGTFTDMAFEYNLTGKATDYEGNTYYGHSNGAGWADYDNDQDMDLWVSHLAHKDDERSGMNRGYYCADSQLFENSGPPYLDFEDVRVDAGIPITQSGTVVQDPDSGDFMWKDEDYFGVAWGDCDNDGDLDLWVPQVKTYSFWDHSFLWENDGDSTFTDSTDTSGLKVWSNTGGTWVDYDNDGDLDFCTEGTYPFRGPRELHLFENPGTSGHWLELDLKGAGGTDQTSTDATGTKVVVRCGNDVFTRYVGGDCGGHGFQQPQRLHFGLGPHTDIDEMFIHWTSGRIQRLVDFSSDQLLTLDEPTTQTVDLDSNEFLFEVDEDGTVSIDITSSGATINGIYWDLDNDRIFETEVANEDIDLTFSGSGIKWLRYRVKDVYQTFWDLEPIIVDVSNIPPDISAPEEIELLEEEVYEVNLSPVDTPSDLVNLSYEWDLGDGEWVEGGPTGNLMFIDMGEYLVQARVTDDDGETDTVAIAISVLNGLPEVSLLCDDVIVEGNSLQLTAVVNDTVKDMDAMRFRFHSGDGRHTTLLEDSIFSFKYTENGTYMAGVEAVDRNGGTSSIYKEVHVFNMVPELTLQATGTEIFEDEEISFSVDVADTDNDIRDIEVRWNFDDGSPWTTWSPDHSFRHTFEDQGTFDVIVQAMDNDDMIGVSKLTINVTNVEPGADISIPPITIFEDQMISFTAELTDSDSDIDDLEHKWIVDGIEMMWRDTDPIIDHTFTTSGEHMVTLIVKDDDVEIWFNETVEVLNMDPVSDLSSSSRSADEDQTLTFDASSSTDTASDRSSLGFLWSLDGEYWENGTSVLKRSFPDSGSYQVSVKVIDDDGAVSVDMVKVTIRNVVPVPMLRTETSVGAGETVVFDASGTYDTFSDLQELVFTFDPGDGSTPVLTTDSIINHTYQDPGEFTVVLAVSDGDETVTISDTITVMAPAEEPAETEDNSVVVLLVVGIFIILLLLALLGVFMVLNKKAQVPPVTDGQVPPPGLPPQQRGGNLPAGRSPPLPPPQQGQFNQIENAPSLPPPPPRDPVQ